MAADGTTHSEGQDGGSRQAVNTTEKHSREGQLNTGESKQYLASWRLAVVLVSLCLGTLLVAIDTTIIGVAVPRISTDFGTFEDIGWYGSAYLLTVTAFQPAFGSIYKSFNAKSIYLVSILIFEVGTTICGAAPNSAAFICGRALSGVGAAGLYQGALGIVGLAVELEKRPMYLGLVLSVFGIAVCFGPPMGGVLTDHVTWRWCFWINLPVGAVCFVLILVFLRLDERRSQQGLTTLAKLRQLDWIGLVLIISTVCCLNLALAWGGNTKPWNSSDVIGLLVGSGTLLLAFGVVQWREGDRAMIPLRILRQRSVIMSAWFSFFLELAVYVALYFMPFYFQSVQGVSATVSGVRAIPLGITQVVSIILTGLLVTRTGHYVPYMVAGQLISIIGTTLMTRIGVETKTAVWATYLCVAGFGHGMGIQTPFTALQVVLSEQDVFVGNAVVVFFSQLGASIAIAIGQSVFSNSILEEVPKFTDAVPAQAVVDVGATGLQKLAGSEEILSLLREAYAVAVQHVLYVSLGGVCIALPFALGMEWLNMKIAGKQQKKTAAEASQDLIVN